MFQILKLNYFHKKTNETTQGQSDYILLFELFKYAHNVLEQVLRETSPMTGELIIKKFFETFLCNH